jgi:hypothetical protein
MPGGGWAIAGTMPGINITLTGQPKVKTL